MNEKTHAYLIAMFYNHFVSLASRQGKAGQGEEAFIQAARRYGEERGRRMALRARRDGQPLNFATYLAYKEWQPSDPEFFEGKVVSFSPDYESINLRCPWAEVLGAEALSACAPTYCAEIDAALVRGFNSDLKFELLHPLAGHDCCRMVFREANLTEGKLPTPLSDDTVRSFSYHCAHLYHVFDEVAKEYFGADGLDISVSVLKEFEDKYGSEITCEMIEASRQDFSKI